MQSSDYREEFYLKCDLQTTQCLGAKYWNESTVFQTDYAFEAPRWLSKWILDLFKIDGCRNLMVQKKNDFRMCLTVDNDKRAPYLSICDHENKYQCWTADMKNVGTWTYLYWNGEGKLYLFSLV